ncbi:hypothetical protein THAOC_15582 [Thalassiosira oceanica]|uniref:Uncharacterized protein n=1 Tax=Thalassiosira oceanica TaxID=159749 RepID=K0SCF1_THAOC|nr:hypothetical protein THAOC_15582 [Thalassiosira oceanica]|eukprot:EJK63743.1 hypothetical protein THAOC_15582 [Thalassiosira oceanica]
MDLTPSAEARPLWALFSCCRPPSPAACCREDDEDEGWSTGGAGAGCSDKAFSRTVSTTSTTSSKRIVVDTPSTVATEVSVDPFSFDESYLLRREGSQGSGKQRSRNEGTDTSLDAGSFRIHQPEQQSCEPASRDECETPRLWIESPAEDMAEKVEVDEIATEVDEDWRNSAIASFGSEETEHIGDLAVVTPMRAEMESGGAQSDLQSEETEPEEEPSVDGITSSDETGIVQIESEDEERQFDESMLNISDPDEARYWYAEMLQESSVKHRSRQTEVGFYQFFLLMILRHLFGWMPGMNDIARDLFLTRPMITQGRQKEDEKEQKQTMTLRRLESRDDGTLQVVPQLKRDSPSNFSNIDE